MENFFSAEEKTMEQIELVDPLDDKAFKILLSDDQCFKLIAESVPGITIASDCIVSIQGETEMAEGILKDFLTPEQERAAEERVTRIIKMFIKEKKLPEIIAAELNISLNKVKTILIEADLLEE